MLFEVKGKSKGQRHGMVRARQGKARQGAARVFCVHGAWMGRLCYVMVVGYGMIVTMTIPMGMKWRKREIG